MRSTAIAVLVLVGVFGVVSLAPAQEKYPTVPYKKAEEHLGQIVWVEGTVLKVLEEPEGTYLCFHNNEKYVRVLVPNKFRAAFEGGLQHRYVGKRIKAIGKVDRFGTGLIVAISEPKRIQIVQESST